MLLTTSVIKCVDFEDTHTHVNLKTQEYNVMFVSLCFTQFKYL